MPRSQPSSRDDSYREGNTSCDSTHRRNSWTPSWNPHCGSNPILEVALLISALLCLTSPSRKLLSITTADLLFNEATTVSATSFTLVLQPDPTLRASTAASASEIHRHVASTTSSM